jgi:two-component system sensor histidine kinase YesM
VKKYTIKSSLIISYSILIMITITFLSTYFCLYSINMLRVNASNSIANLSKSICNKLDSEIERMNSISINVAYSNLIKDRFSQYLSVSQKESFKSDIYLNNEVKALNDIFIAIIGPLQTVSQLNLYDFNNRMIGAGIYNQLLDISVEKQPWYNEVLKLDGKRYFSTPSHDPLLESSFTSSLNIYSKKKYISLIRLYFDSYRNMQGIIEVKQDCDTLFSGIDNIVNSQPNLFDIYVYNNDDQLVYPYKSDTNNNSNDFMKIIKEQKTSENSFVYTPPDTNNKCIVSYASSSQTAWTVVIQEPEHVLFSPIFTFVKITLIISIALLLATLLISYFLATKLTIPIKQINKAIKELSINDLSIQSPSVISTNLNELETLNLTFQNMQIKMKKAIEELLLSQHHEMESKLVALQAQMNPHFLYNMLTNIIVMADNKMNDKIITTCLNLSGILRYLSSDKTDSCTVQDEIEHSLKYLNCMGIRYLGKLIYDFSIPETMNSI